MKKRHVASASSTRSLKYLKPTDVKLSQDSIDSLTKASDTEPIPKRCRQIYAVLFVLPHIETLHIGGEVSPSLIGCIGIWLPFLKVLNLPEAQIDQHILVKIITSCTRLEELLLNGVCCDDLDDLMLDCRNEFHKDVIIDKFKDKLELLMQSLFNHGSLRSLQFEDAAEQEDAMTFGVEPLLYYLLEHCAKTGQKLKWEVFHLRNIYVPFTTLIDFLSSPLTANLKHFEIGFFAADLYPDELHDEELNPEWTRKCLQSRHDCYATMKGDLEVVSWTADLPEAFFEVIGPRIKSFQANGCARNVEDREKIMSAIQHGHLANLERLEIVSDPKDDMEEWFAHEVYGDNVKTPTHPCQEDFVEAVKKYGPSFQLTIRDRIRKPSELSESESDGSDESESGETNDMESDETEASETESKEASADSEDE